MKIGSNSMHPFLNMVNISKSFLDVKALQEVNLSINENEIVGLVGENGAGKSTLVKILAGVYKADQGKYLLMIKTYISTILKMQKSMESGLCFKSSRF